MSRAGTKYNPGQWRGVSHSSLLSKWPRRLVNRYLRRRHDWDHRSAAAFGWSYVTPVSVTRSKTEVDRYGLPIADAVGCPKCGTRMNQPDHHLERDSPVLECPICRNCCLLPPTAEEVALLFTMADEAEPLAEAADEFRWADLVPIGLVTYLAHLPDGTDVEVAGGIRRGKAKGQTEVLGCWLVA